MADIPHHPTLNTTRTCPTCHRTLPLTAFPFTGKSYRRRDNTVRFYTHTQCQPCRTRKEQLWYQARKQTNTAQRAGLAQPPTTS